MGVLIARNIMQLLRAEVPKDLEDLNVEVEGPEQRYGAQVVTVNGPYSEVEVIRKHRYNSGWRGVREDLPSDEPTIGTATTVVQELQPGTGQLHPCWGYAQITLEGQVLLLNRITKNKFANILNTYVEDMLAVRDRERNREWHGDGTGRLCTVQADTAIGLAVVPVRRDDQTNFRYRGEGGGRFMWEGSTFVPRRNTVPVGTAAYMVNGPVAVVGGGQGIDNVPITPAIVGTALVAGDFLVRGDFNGNAFNREPNGFGNIFDDGRVEALHIGIDRTAFPEMGLYPELWFEPTGAEGAATHYQELTQGVMHRMLSLAFESTQKRDFVVAARPEVLDVLPWQDVIRAPAAGDMAAFGVSAFMGNANQGGGLGPGQFGGGVKSYKQFHPDVNVTFVRDFWAPYSTLLGFRPEHLEVHVFEKWHAEPGFLSLMPNGFYPALNRDTYRARYRTGLNVMHRRPFEAFKATGCRCQIDAARVS